MNLSEESFPEDDLFTTKEETKLESFDKTKSLSNNTSNNSIFSTVGQSSSEASNNIQINEDINTLYGKKNKVLKLKSYSYQDLHSDYSKKRYKHVKSKVREYIDNIRAQDRQREQITRHKSLPETFNDFSKYEALNDDLDSNEITQLLQQKDQEVQELKSLNEYLENNLEEKSKMLATLKRKEDIMRLELYELKEKEKAKRYSPTNRFRYQLSAFQEQKNVTVATQTENNLNGLDVVNLNLESSLFNLTENENENVYNLRRRTFSNSLIYDGDTTKNLSRSQVTTCNGNTSTDPVKCKSKDLKKHKKRLKSNKLVAWKRFICKTMFCCNSEDTSSQNDYFYSQISFSDVQLASPN